MLRDPPFKFFVQIKVSSISRFLWPPFETTKDLWTNNETSSQVSWQFFVLIMLKILLFLGQFNLWSWKTNTSCFSTKLLAPPTNVQKLYEHPNDQVKRAGGILVGRENCILASPFQAAKSSHPLKIMIWRIWLLPVGHWIPCNKGQRTKMSLGPQQL